MNNLIKKVFSVSQTNSLLILRLALGIIFFAHGAQKLLGWFGGYGWAGTIGFFSQTLNIPPSLAGLTISIEFLGGIAIILGLLTRPAAFGLAIISLVAMLKVHWVNGFFLEGAKHGIEFIFALFMIALFLVIEGAGPISFDRLIYGQKADRK
ncbi:MULTISPECIES: DoxX family protein [Desulfosporosinus]|uniref:DoxX family protein n=1 Tax=Desulfosporosinus nitroreducens TaxID=2018668 RepID=A0ABT8QPA3_9FIRM|nr:MULTISPECIES: DoxX family protein [Desulfosporosinus]MCO5385151.1 DoxX family protein [Desulfosporosinus sp.]MDA8221407.1 DoxX family protein [Desulfitobacterium hafniense]MDO0823151.1 DoxX family protein [Desulfosporosinus nitroreducens]